MFKAFEMETINTKKCYYRISFLHRTSFIRRFRGGYMTHTYIGVGIVPRMDRSKYRTMRPIRPLRIVNQLKRS